MLGKLQKACLKNEVVKIYARTLAKSCFLKKIGKQNKVVE
jgi:hypothetical protein